MTKHSEEHEILIAAIMNNYSQRVNNIMVDKSYDNWEVKRLVINNTLKHCRDLIWQSLDDLIDEIKQ